MGHLVRIIMCLLTPVMYYEHNKRGLFVVDLRHSIRDTLRNLTFLVITYELERS
jgi:hypothetical protein